MSGKRPWSSRAFVTFCTDPVVVPKTYEVRRCGVLPSGEALLSCPLWNKADLLTDFCLPWNSEILPPRTEFKGLWDGERFGFHFDVTDHDIVIGEGDSPGSRALESDRVELFWARDGHLDPYWGFEMNPNGDVLAYEGRYHRQMNWDWQCPDWQVVAELRPDGYRVAGSVSIEVLREWGVWRETSQGGGETMTGVYRGEFSRGPGLTVRRDWISWVHPETEIPDFHVPASFGRFVFHPAG